MADAGLPGPGTFEHAARDWLVTVHGAKVSAGHAERTRIRFEQDAIPWIDRRPVAEIDAPELLATPAPYPQLIGDLLSLPRTKPSHSVMSCA